VCMAPVHEALGIGAALTALARLGKSDNHLCQNGNGIDTQTYLSKKSEPRFGVTVPYVHFLNDMLYVRPRRPYICLLGTPLCQCHDILRWAHSVITTPMTGCLSAPVSRQIVILELYVAITIPLAFQHQIM
jgi:hypothetical protein